MKSKLYSLSAFTLLSISLLSGCNQNPQSKNQLDLKSLDTSTQTIFVQDTDGKSISNAQILIGDSVGVPFAANLVTTDANGQLTIPAAWSSAATVSVSAAGYITASFLHMPPASHYFKLRKQTLPSTIEYSGNTIGYPAFNDYSVAHVSLIFEALKRSDLANFSLSKIISPESDTISVVGSNVALPSNISIPSQTLSYIIHIKVSKPIFHIPLQVNSDHLMVGLHAQFPVTDLVKAVRSKENIFDMVNFFNFTSMNQGVQHIDETSVSQNFDISQTQLTLKNHVQAQKFDPGLVLLAISAYSQNDSLIPLDVKKLSSGAAIDLNTLSSNHASEKTIAVLRSSTVSASDTGATQELMSVSVHDSTTATLPVQLPTLAAPSVSSNVIDQVLPVSANTNILSEGIYYSYAEVQSQTSANVLIENKNPLWDVYNPTWEEKAQLPTLPTQMLPASTATMAHRWSVSVLGQDTADSSDLGPDRLKTVNYLTRAAVDIK